MSIKVDNNDYLNVRNNDPAYQVLTRITDANNIYDIKQTYIKNGTTRNDFNTQLETFRFNRGILCDGTPIDKSKFFMNSVLVTRGNQSYYVGESIDYFKFKTNALLDFRTKSKIKDTYINKTNYESIYDLKTTEEVINGQVVLKYGWDDEKIIKENEISSFPLQRVDKLVIHELASMFIYVNGRKIPDNELFVYTNRSATDVFMPAKYFGAGLDDPKSVIDATIYIDVRQAGSECFYYRDKNFTGKSLDLNLNDPEFKYNKVSKSIDVEQLLIFVDGYLIRASSLTKDGADLHIELEEVLSNSDIEIYILNDLIYRYNKPDGSVLNINNSKVHFFLPDDYIVDVISGPITKQAVSFFYDKKKIDDDLITQTSRFSFEFELFEYEYNRVTLPLDLRPLPGKTYYTKVDDDTYVKCDNLVSFDIYTAYYTRDRTERFDEEKMDFFIEDIDFKVNDSGFITYGDDYYLLNMLGVKRSVDKMKGRLTYSVFDNYPNLSFRKTLSNNGELFDIDEAHKKYDYYDTKISTPEIRLKRLISERPTLLRELITQFKIPSKILKVYGNAKDLVLSSIGEIVEQNTNLYYKIYINGILLDAGDYTTERISVHDIITVDKKHLSNGINNVEMFQFDLSYREKTIFKDQITQARFSRHVDTNGEYYFSCTYNLADLPFGVDFLLDDIVAIERVEKKWYTSDNDEYFMVYPSEENIGYRPIKNFRIYNKTDTHVTVDIQLYEYDGGRTNREFFLLSKQYNVVESLIYSNLDNSYMIDNDLLIPIYSSYIEYGMVDGVKTIINVDKYIPYINNSEPIITRNGRELIFGKDYTFVNPSTNDVAASSYIVFKNQLTERDVINCQFNSSKTNILIVGYDDLNVDNKYGLLYLSELTYPVSTEYMNIYINGEKISKYNLDILSDKLIRVYDITTPIKTVLITTNMLYKTSEIQDYIDCYKESEFEKLLENIFWNCDPSKKIDSNRPAINYVYKVDPYYSDFIGDEDYNNTYYDEYVETIIENKYNYNKNSIFEVEFPPPTRILYYSDEEFELAMDAWSKAKVFFDVYKSNHGFETQVDSVNQKENAKGGDEIVTYLSDTLEIMYLNWLSTSGKTKSYGYKEKNINPNVLRYFSIFENNIIDNRLDIVVDSNRFYEGLRPDVNNEPIIYETEYPDPNNPIYVYPGAQLDIKRRYFYLMLLKALEAKEPDEELFYDYETNDNPLLDRVCELQESNILYPEDFPLKPDTHGIKWNGMDVDIVNYEDPILD